MLALQKAADRQGLELRDVPSPGAPEAGEVLIEVAATGICGSDIAIESWTISYSAFMNSHLPVTLGHETAGVVVAAGPEVDPAWVGRRVVVNPAVACGKCVACRSGDDVDSSKSRIRWKKLSWYGNSYFCKRGSFERPT